MNPSPLTKHPGNASAFTFFEARPGVAMILLPDTPRYTIVAVSNDFVITSGMDREDVTGKGHFAVFPENPDDPSSSGIHSLRNSFEYILQHKTSHSLPLVRYDIPDGKGGFLEKYWKSTNAPVLNESGAVVYVIHTSEDVTDQVKAEQAEEAHQQLLRAYQKIEESERKYHRLFESIDQGFCLVELIYDDQGKPIDHLFLETNRNYETQTGLKDVEGKTAREVMPGIETHWFEIYDQVAQSGKPIRFSEESQALERWFDVFVYPASDAASKRVAVLFTDITEPKKAEEALRASEQRQTFLLRLNDHLRTLAKPLEIQYEAAKLIAIYVGADRVGYAEVGGDGTTVKITTEYTNGDTSLVGQYKNDDYGPELLRALRKGQSVVRSDIADDITLSDGEKEAHATLGLGTTVNVPLLKDGSLIAIFFLHFGEAHHWTWEEVSLIGEVAERTWEAVIRARVEQALRQSEERFRIMVDTIPQSIWITDANGHAEYLNKHWCDYCGVPFSDTTAQEISMKYLHPEDGPKVMQAFGAAMQTGEPWEVEQRNLSKDGEYRWFLNRGTPYRDLTTGQVIKWFGVGIDIHDRKLADEALRASEEALEKKVAERTQELEKANSELKRSNQNLEEFAYAASHDMKEPIRKIHFFADRLRQRLAHKLEEEDNRYFERLEAGAKRMSSLIDDLLLYSHVNRGVNSLDTVDLNQMLSFVMDDLELQIEQRGARVEVGPLPTILGRPRQLQQLFENLIANALKYSKQEVMPVVSVTARIVKGEEALTHSLPVGAGKNYHLIEVKDNGIGFEQTDAERIFKVFTRLHGNAEYRGTGVGLSIAQKIVENHGGFIWADSKVAEGATFSILLPVE